jgi:hypothetical protein
MGAWSYFGAPAAVDFFPEGEATQRALQGEYQKSLEAWQKGDTAAMGNFFDKYPEYEARMALYRDPESRLKQFLISEVWNRYNGLPDLYKKQLRDQLGDLFNQAFLQKETRSYDSINTQTLSMWAQTMGGTLPTAAGTIPEAPVTLASPEVAKAYQDFRDQVEQKWPNIYSVQEIYYRIPPGKVRTRTPRNIPRSTSTTSSRMLILQRILTLFLMRSVKRTRSTTQTRRCRRCTTSTRRSATGNSPTSSNCKTSITNCLSPSARDFALSIQCCRLTGTGSVSSCGSIRR